MTAATHVGPATDVLPATDSPPALEAPSERAKAHRAALHRQPKGAPVPAPKPGWRRYHGVRSGRRYTGRYEVRERVPAWLLIAGIMTLAFLLRATRLSESYDLFVDEPFYTMLGQSVAHGHLPYATGSRFFLHPPGFFPVEALWVHLTGDGGRILDQVFRMRYLVAIIASVEAGLMCAIGSRLAGRKAGLIAGVAFAINPWLIRQQSIVLLEPAALVWVLMGYWLVLTLSPKSNARGGRLLAAGFCFGMGVLSKEFSVAITFVPLALIGWRQWGITRREASITLAAACMPYLVWFFIVLDSGSLGDWWVQTTAGFRRGVGVSQQSGFNAPNAPSFLSVIITNLYQFWTCYTLLAVGLATLPYLLRRKSLPPLRMLGAFLLGGLLLITYCVLAGANEEQFLNYVLIPAILATGVGLSRLWERGVSGFVTPVTWPGADRRPHLRTPAPTPVRPAIDVPGGRSSAPLRQLLADLQTFVPPEKPPVPASERFLHALTWPFRLVRRLAALIWWTGQRTVERVSAWFAPIAARTSKQRVRSILAAVATVAILSDLANWTYTHTVPDNGTEQMAAWVYGHIPTTTPIATTNPVQREIFIYYPMVEDTAVDSLAKSPVKAKYVAVFWKQVDQGYASIGWTDLHQQLRGAKVVFSTTDRSNGRMEIYQVAP
jgi:hypothetical protein